MDENVKKNGQPSLKDGTKIMQIEIINQNYMDGPWWVKYFGLYC